MTVAEIRKDLETIQVFKSIKKKIYILKTGTKSCLTINQTAASLTEL